VFPFIIYYFAMKDGNVTYKRTKGNSHLIFFPFAQIIQTCTSDEIILE